MASARNPIRSGIRAGHKYFISTAEAILKYLRLGFTHLNAEGIAGCRLPTIL